MINLQQRENEGNANKKCTPDALCGWECDSAPLPGWDWDIKKITYGNIKRCSYIYNK